VGAQKTWCYVREEYSECQTATPTFFTAIESRSWRFCDHPTVCAALLTPADLADHVLQTLLHLFANFDTVGQLLSETTKAASELTIKLVHDGAHRLAHGVNASHHQGSSTFCNEWALANGKNTSVAGKKLSGLNVTSCDPDVAYFDDGQGDASRLKYDSTAILVSFFALCLVMVCCLSDYSPASDKTTPAQLAPGFHLSLVRLGCFFIYLITSGLIFTAAVQLLAASQANTNRGADTDAQDQMAWSTTYFFVSYVALHGGFLVLTKDSFDATPNDETPGDEPHDSDGGEGSPSRTSKMVASLKWAKAQFFEPDGKYFHYKLAALEIFEVAVQVSSLLSGAKNSEAHLVVISALLIAANFILIPVAAIMGTRCFSGAAFASRTIV
jgi:hypothetical protein